MHQASILFSFFTMVMGGAWIVLHEMPSAEAEAGVPAAVVGMAVERAADIALDR